MGRVQQHTPFLLVGHFVTLQVVVDGVQGTFVLDTGIGLTILSESFAAAVGCAPQGLTYTGRRMSGQEVAAPVGRVQSLKLGGLGREDVGVGVIDLVGLPQGIDGFLSLEFFRDSPFTVDYAAQTIVVESEQSLLVRADEGACIDVRVERDDHAATVFVPFEIPGNGPIEVEVDMGSDTLILDEALASRVGVDLANTAVRTVEDQDETGHTYVRHFAGIRGSIGSAQAPSVRQLNPDVMFQKIIYDGLVGHSFLRNFVVTYDLPRSRMIFGN